jgi:hypothetical protein
MKLLQRSLGVKARMNTTLSSNLIESFSPDEKRFFQSLDPKTFADFALSMPRFDFYTSNLVESFNNLIEKERNDPVSILVEKVTDTDVL